VIFFTKMAQFRQRNLAFAVGSLLSKIWAGTQLAPPFTAFRNRKSAFAVFTIASTLSHLITPKRVQLTHNASDASNNNNNNNKTLTSKAP